MIDFFSDIIQDFFNFDIFLDFMKSVVAVCIVQLIRHLFGGDLK